MYAWPQYQKINLSRELQNAFPQYSLHLYRETRRQVEPMLDWTPLQLRGVPVLFIPGNAGSHKQGKARGYLGVGGVGKADMVGCDYGKQRANALILLHFCFLLVRSSASIALQMHWKEFRHLSHFDFFTVNLNEQFSGLFGGVLESQTSELLPPPSFMDTR